MPIDSSIKKLTNLSTELAARSGVCWDVPTQTYLLEASRKVQTVIRELERIAPQKKPKPIRRSSDWAVSKGLKIKY